MTSTVDHPKHYQAAAELARPVLSFFVSESMLELECIEAIEQLNLGFTSGNVLKYLWRAGQKSDQVLEDLQKARWYLVRCIDRSHLCGLGNTKKALQKLDELIANLPKPILPIGSTVRLFWGEGNINNRTIKIAAIFESANILDSYVVYQYQDGNRTRYGTEQLLYFERVFKDGVATVIEAL